MHLLLRINLILGAVLAVAAVLLSFASSCQRLAVEPWAYLQDVLTRLPGLPAERLVELLPDRWQAARLAAPLVDTQAGAGPVQP